MKSRFTTSNTVIHNYVSERELVIFGHVFFFVDQYSTPTSCSNEAYIQTDLSTTCSPLDAAGHVSVTSSEDGDIFISLCSVNKIMRTNERHRFNATVLSRAFRRSVQRYSAIDCATDFVYGSHEVITSAATATSNGNCHVP